MTNDIRRRVCADCDYQCSDDATLRLKICPDCGSKELQTVRFTLCIKCYTYMREADYQQHIDTCEGI